MDACLSRDLAERYVSGGCSEDEQQTIEAHLAQCEGCRQQAEAIRLKTTAAGQPDLTMTYDSKVADRAGEERQDSTTPDVFIR